MKVSFITPTRYIHNYGVKSDFILALSHLIDLEETNEYEKAIIATGLPIILDNGLFENKFPEPTESLIDKALKINADSVFAPDILYDRKRTESAFDDTWRSIIEQKIQNQLKLNIVIQADNAYDYIQSYKKFINDNRVNLIGLSILTIPKCFESLTQTKDIATNRIECMSYLNTMLNTHRSSHLLGAGSSYRDVAYANKYCPWVVSHDSSSAFWNGVHDKRILTNLDIKGGKTEITVDFNYNKELTRLQELTIDLNMSRIRSITK